MDKDLLEKHKKDPAWDEVIQLYSGLYDNQDEREEFILNIAREDIILATRCKANSALEEPNLKEILYERIKEYLKDFKNPKSYLEGLFAILELGQSEIKYIKKTFKFKVKTRYLKRLVALSYEMGDEIL